MIFLTLGTQLPFDRLLQYMDDIARTYDEEVFGQIGRDNTYKVTQFDCTETVNADEYARLMQACRVVVSHAGIGTVLSAKRFGKPLIVVPRIAAKGEHRNDHQVATAQQLQDFPGIRVANTQAELLEHLQNTQIEPPETGVTPQLYSLTDSIGRFITKGEA